MKDIARDADVSVNTVSRLLKPLAVSVKYLPEVLCIDEFKGNTGYYKYQVSLMDDKTKKPIDIIECRYKTHLLDYFNNLLLQFLNDTVFLQKQNHFQILKVN